MDGQIPTKTTWSLTFGASLLYFFHRNPLEHHHARHPRTVRRKYPLRNRRRHPLSVQHLSTGNAPDRHGTRKLHHSFNQNPVDSESYRNPVPTPRRSHGFYWLVLRT